MPKYELQYTDDIDFVHCPYCNWGINKEQTEDWDFMDEETNIIKCESCKKDYKVLVNRPIEYVVGRKQDF